MEAQFHDEGSGMTEDQPELTSADVTIEIGECALRFRSVTGKVQFVVRFPHTNFVIPPVDYPDCDIWCEVGPIRQFDAPVVFRAEMPAWEIRRDAAGTDEVTYFTPRGGIETARLAARFTPDLRRVDLQQRFFDQVDERVSIGFPLDELIISRLLTQRSSLVLHACCVEVGGQALVFMGHSGAGKSTIAEIAEEAGAAVLSDDRTILEVPDDGRIRAHGTPWHGSFRRGRRGALPVAGIYLLVQAAENRTQPLSPVAVVGELFVRTIQPTIRPGEVDLVLRTVERLGASVPVRTLFFRPDAHAFTVACRDARLEIT